MVARRTFEQLRDEIEKKPRPVVNKPTQSNISRKTFQQLKQEVEAAHYGNTGKAEYVAKSGLLGAGRGISGVEDAARITVANEMKQAAKVADKKGFDRLRQNVLGGGMDALNSFRWERKNGVFGNLLNLGGTFANASLEFLLGLSGAEGAKNELQLASAKGNADAINEEADRISRKNVSSDILGLDKAENSLAYAAQNQGKGTLLAGDIAGAIGGMAPAITAGVLTKNPNIGMSIMSASAGGSKAREAIDSGADTATAYQAGLTTGLKEYAVEKAVGGLPGLGEGFLSPAVSRVVKGFGSSPLGKTLKYAINAGGEGIEEMTADLLQAYIDRGTFDPETTNATKEELLRSGAIGAAVSLVLGVPVSFDSRGRVVTDKAARTAFGKKKYTKDHAEARQQLIDTLVQDGVLAQEGAAVQADAIVNNGAQIDSQQAEPASSTVNNVADSAVKQDANSKLAALKSKHRADVAKAKKIQDPDERDMALTELEYLYEANVHALAKALDTEAAQIAMPQAVDSSALASYNLLGSESGLPVFEDYNEALAYRDSLMDKDGSFAVNDTSWDSDLDNASSNPIMPAGSGPEHINQAAINTVPKAAESGLISEENAADVASSPDLITNTITHEDDIRTADAFIEQKGGLEAASEWASGRLNDQTPFNISEMAVLRELIRRNNQMGTSLGNDRAVRFMESAMKQFSDAGRLLEFAKAFVQDNPTQFVTMAKKTAPEAVNKQMEADLLALGNLAATGHLRAADVDNMSDDMALWFIKAQAYLGDKSFNDIASARALVMMNELRPKDRRQQFRALQRVSMLSNPKTHVRNVLGNIVFGATETVANPIASIFDHFLSGITGQQTFGSGGAAARAAGTVEGVQNAILDQALGLNLVATKYGENPQGFAKAFVNKGVGKYINKADGAIGFLLKLGDEPFRNGQYESVLAQLVNANPEAVAANGGKPTAEMIDTAIESAYRRTFQDNNKIVNAFRDVREALPYIGETIAPFVKTPANVVKVAIEYSPIGVVEAIAKTYWGKNSIKALQSKGESTMNLQRDAAELFGRGLVGSGLMLLGGILAGAGMAIGDDDDMSVKEQGWASTTGKNPGTVKIGDNYVDLSTMQTFAAPLMAGASTKNGDWAGILQAAANVGNTALEMPVLQGVQELFGGNEDGLPEIVANILASSMTQLIPMGSALRQAATLADPYSRTTQPDAKGVGGVLERGWNKVKNTIPGLRETLPQVYDTLGNPVVSYEADSGIGRAANVLFNPFTTDKEYKTSVTDEIDRLYQETFNQDVLPGKASRSFSNDKVKYELTRAEMQEFQKVEGKTTRLMLEELVQSQAYKDASLEEQVDMVADAVSYGYEEAKSDYLGKQGVAYDKSAAAKRIAAAVDIGLSTADSLIMTAEMQQFEGEGTADNIRRYLYESDLDAEQKNIMAEAYNVSTEGYNWDEGSYDEFLFFSGENTDTKKQRWQKMESAGLDFATYADGYEIIWDRTKGYLKEQKLADMMEKYGWSYGQAEYFWDAVRNGK